MPYDAEKASDVKSMAEKLKKTYKNISDTAARQAIHVFTSVMDSTGDEGKAWASVYSAMNARGLTKKGAFRSEMIQKAASMPPGSEERRAILAGLTASPEQKQLVGDLLLDILSCLQAMRVSYQVSHWVAEGDDYYGDHLMFQRLYEGEGGLGDEIDGLAEKIVGYLGGGVIRLSDQVEGMSHHVRRWAEIPDSRLRGLRAEEDLQVLLRRAYDRIKEAGAMTLGLDDWIMATASAHEANQYLLQQAAGR